MASEIKVATSIAVKNGAYQYSNATSQTITQTNKGGCNPGVVQLSTTQEQIQFGELSTPGWTEITNLDATNYVSFGNYVSAVFYPIIRVDPGETCLFRMSESAVLYGKANAGTPKVVIRVQEN